jgi:hypothetical protein
VGAKVAQEQSGYQRAGRQEAHEQRDLVYTRRPQLGIEMFQASD